MSTTEPVESSEHFLTPHQRRYPVILPTDPSDDELARHWTLSAADIRQVLPLFL